MNYCKKAEKDHKHTSPDFTSRICGMNPAPGEPKKKYDFVSNNPIDSK